ncbi:hypothetical protein CDAR_450801 [Caerostris darwini]|uniref:Uncharacterized protein n=1 Tax=Caerostris darwini TaxID=1538125 RepID=A0AAV4V7S1_9ARAC|nr:hypothetical protein CDAR_450801 [Caerostris darwini]
MEEKQRDPVSFPIHNSKLLSGIISLASHRYLVFLQKHIRCSSEHNSNRKSTLKTMVLQSERQPINCAYHVHRLLLAIDTMSTLDQSNQS